MNQQEILNKILEAKIVAILRVKDYQKVVPSALAILEGGVKAIEVSLNTPNTLSCISELSKIHGLLPGVGTVTTVQEVRDAVNAGAEFIVSPITKQDLIETSHELGKPIFSGAFTPGEIYQAYEWGADVVKVFPAETVGMRYIKAVKAPFPDIKLMPTGGVNASNIDQWFDMGADCVGIGSCFTKESIMANEDWPRQTARTKELVKNLEHFLETR